MNYFKVPATGDKTSEQKRGCQPRTNVSLSRSLFPLKETCSSVVERGKEKGGRVLMRRESAAITRKRM